MDYSRMKPYEVRKLIRKKEITGPTAGMCSGYTQANLVILPKELAYDFLLFTVRNPKSCPILEVGDCGSRTLSLLGKDIDITTDIPKYRVYKNGIMAGEYTDIEKFWRDDFVSFLIGCSFSFESDLLEADIEIRHIEEQCNVPMYITNIDCIPAGIFNGKMVVSMRPIPYEKIVESVLISGSMPKVHGAPVHIGNPSVIGISDINKPDFGDKVTIKQGEVPVFWPCGVTPQAVIMNVKPEIVITHAPGHMLITDIKNISLKY
ncbi:MAG: putative hydro-lyase [Clostridium sp.]